MQPGQGLLGRVFIFNTFDLTNLEKIALIGEKARREEFVRRLPDLSLAYEGDQTPAYEVAEGCGVFVDLNLDEHPQRLPFYFRQKAILIGSSVKRNLRQQRRLFVGELDATFLGINALPTFVGRPVWEVTAMDEEGLSLWKELADTWKVDIEPVGDQVGMVTPRILFPIINEAYIMWQEGTAEPTDIDTAMKLGTNYPKGPIAWANEIGLKNVVEVLNRLYEDLGAARFVPCRLLKERANLGG